MIQTSCELRKKDKADRDHCVLQGRLARDLPLYLSAVTMGNYAAAWRGFATGERSVKLERWLDTLLADYSESILSFDADAAQVWGRLRVPHPENPLDKQIAATALLYDLILVTRNVQHFASTGVKLFDRSWADTEVNHLAKRRDRRHSTARIAV